MRTTHLLKLVCSLLAVFSALLVAQPASARSVIKQPGAHPDYSVELEPHLVLQWARDPFNELGIGVGLRAAIPFLDNGPISTINNNMAIGFGIDWAHFEDNCWGFYRGRFRGNFDPRFEDDDCTADVFHFPVVLQWNFFLTDVISVFGEPGLSIEHREFDIEFCDGGFCGDLEDDETEIEFVFWGGARFLFGETAGLLVRVGVPYVSVGATILF